jgi:hypothetical protein
VASMIDLIVIAADEIPPDSIMAQLIVPIGLLVFLGSTYLLLRSNLGTRRAYYMLGTCTFAFLFIMSVFWGFGAPGTPQATGPQNLPGQTPDALLEKWVPFAQDSRLADRPDLSIVKDHPEGFEEGGWPADFEEHVDSGVDDIQSFFASEEAGEQVGDLWEAEVVAYAVTDTGLPVLAVEFREVDEEGEEGEGTYTAFGFWDEGSPLLPSFIFMGVSFLGLIVHGFLLDRDERRERRRYAAETAEGEQAPERVPART